MAEIFSYIKPLSNLTGLAKPDGSFKLYSEQLSSINFDGVATKKQIKTKVSDLKSGQTVMISDATYTSTSAFITKIESRDGFINDDPEQPVLKYYLYHLSEFSMEQPFTYNATYGDSYSANAELYVIKDDVENFVLGNDGWTLTNNGNAIFSNIFARGTIEATSGKIDGNLEVGTNPIGGPLVTIGSDLFKGKVFESVEEKHSGILLDVNNYLLSYPAITQVPVTSVVVTNSSVSGSLYSATFTIPLGAGEANTLQVGDFVKLSGFTHPNTTALNTTHQVSAVTSNTFTIPVSYNINLTSPVTINVSVTSFALIKTYNLTSMTLSSTSDTIDNSTVKIYLDDSDFFSVGTEISLESFLGNLLPLNGVSRIVDQGSGYISVYSKRIAAGTYTSSLGSIVLYSKVQKFKVGDNFNYMSFSSETGSLKLTGTINAHSGNFINQVYVGQAATTFYIYRKKLASNIATLSTTEPHSFSVGDIVTIIGVDATFNGTYTVKATPTATTFTYDKTASPVSEVDLVNFGYVSSDSSVDGTIKVGVADTGITIDGTGDPLTSAIYAGEGEYANANTGFWMDASGRFSLKDKLIFDTSGNLTVSGTINASAGNFTNTVYVGTPVTPATLQVGRGDNFFQITGTNTDSTTAIKTNGASFNGTGIWLDASGRFSLGNQLKFENGNLTIAGGLTATAITVGTSPNQMIMSPTAIPGGSGSPGLYMSKTGDFINATSGNFRLGNGGVTWDTASSKLTVNGILSGYVTTDIVAVAAADRMAIGYFNAVSGGAPAGVGLKLDENNYWFVGNKFKVGGTDNYVNWNGSSLSVAGQITATSGNIAGWQILPTRLESSGIGFVAPAIPTRVNQIINPSFESSSGYWYLTIGGVKQQVTRTYDENATPVIDASTDPDTYAGNIYLNVSAPTGVSGDAILYHTGLKDPQDFIGTGVSRIKTTPAEPYTFSIYVKSQVSRNVTLSIQWYNDLNTILSTAISTIDTTTVGSWKRFNITATAPTGAVSAVPFLKIAGMLAGEIHKVDAAMFEKTSELRQYFDGDSNLSTWINNNNISNLKEGESRYGEVSIYTGRDYVDRSTSPFFVSYNGFVSIKSGNLSTFALSDNAITHDHSSEIFTKYIELSTDETQASAPRIAVVSYQPELQYTTSNIIAPTWTSGQIKYTIVGHTLSIGDVITISGFANTNYNLSNAIIVNKTDKEIFLSVSSNPGSATGTGIITVLQASKFSAQWASDHTAFYASTDGSVSIGSALSYDSEAGLSVTGEVQGTQGWIGGENGWKFDSSGLLRTGTETDYFAFPSQSSVYFTAPISLNVTRTIADDQWEEFNQLFSNYYAEVDISSLSADYKNAPFDSLKNIGFTLDFTGTTGIDSLLKNKTLSSQAVYDRRAFFIQSAIRYYRYVSGYSSGTTTIQFPALSGSFVIQNIGTSSPSYATSADMVGATVSGTGIQAGTIVISADLVNGRITLSKPTTATTTGKVSLYFEKDNSGLKATTTLPIYAVSRVSGVTTLYFENTKIKSSVLDAINTEFKLNPTTSMKIKAFGSTTLVNSLNDATIVVSTVSTGLDDLSRSSLTFNQTGQPDIALTYTTSANVEAYIPLPTNTYTLVFYPEEAGVYIHNESPVPEGGRTYTAGQHILKFYDLFTTQINKYYMWGGSQTPSSAPLSISKNVATEKFLIKADAGTTPVGSIVMWSESTPPTGWIICNGQSTTAYPLLTAVVGANVPDLRDRFIVGAGLSYGLKSAGGSANHDHGDNFAFNGGDHSHGNTASSAATGGSHNHAHTISVNSHNHSDNIDTGSSNSNSTRNTTAPTGGVAAPAHTHTKSGNVSTNTPANQGGNISGAVSNSASHSHTVTTTMTNNNSNVGALGKSGSVTAGSTIPPYYALYFIIYTGKIT
jgi:microcystin-dependent protein